MKDWHIRILKNIQIFFTSSSFIFLGVSELNIKPQLALVNERNPVI